MSEWEYSSDIVAPGESSFVVCSVRGAEGWEAWHLERRHDGWREIYFKRLRASGEKGAKPTITATMHVTGPGPEVKP